jgi:SLT domain-containing protein
MAGAALAMLPALAGCGHQQAPMSADKEAAQYLARAKHDYRPPGPPGDPWGPYIVEAAAKYDVPETWVRGVIRQESGGRLYENGKLITSSAGAMGLMQVMPGTFDELRARYNLGDDPFDPHDNIMAGTAYIRELYDLYGSPGFLAAYNAGPKRLDDYLSHNRPLPDETRHYVARIGPNIAGAYPQRLSPASQYAMNQLPVNIPPGPRYPKTRAQAPVALAANTRRSNGWTKNDVQMASLPAPPAAAPQPMLQLASAQSMPDTPPKPPGGGFHIIPRAMAETMPVTRGGPVSGNWAIQVGAYASESQARSAAVAAKTQTTVLASAQPVVGTVRQSKATLYRARLTGLSRDAAVQACEKISHHGNCIVVSPDAQS